MRIGVLTGGGDCPGLNAVIRAVVRKGVGVYGHEFVGFRDGWKGPLENITMPLGIPEVRGILPRGGTILGSSRTNPFKVDDGFDRITATLHEHGVDALIAIGGEDTLGVATKLGELGINVVGVPKTIDNDLNATDYTFGFDTAVNIAMEAIDRLHTTAESHHRALIVEVMGRHAGLDRAARRAGRRRERHPDPRAAVLARAGVRLRREPLPVALRADPRGRRGRDAGRRRDATLEKGLDAFGHVRLGGIGEWLAGEIEKRTGKEARTTVLGHIQRGGTPSAFDRVLATRFGLHAVDAVQDGAWGQMVALRGTDIVRVPLAEATTELKTVKPELYAEAEVLFG